MISHINKNKVPESIVEQYVREQVQKEMLSLYKAFKQPVPLLPWQIALPSDDDIPY